MGITECWHMWPEGRSRHNNSIHQYLYDCKYFIVYGETMYGWYERDGKRYPTRLWSGICYCDMINTKCLRTSYHAVIDDFRQWLENSGWWPDWWE